MRLKFLIIVVAGLLLLIGSILYFNSQKDIPISASSMLSTPNNQKSSCLYYAVRNEVYKFCFSDMKSILICAIPQEIKPRMMTEIKAASGNLLWRSGNKLYSWDGKKINAIALEGFKTSYGYLLENEKVIPELDETFIDDFLISPDGRLIAWNINQITNVIDDNSGTAFIVHRIYASNIDGSDKRLVFKENLKVTGVHADAGLERRLIYWSKKMENQLILSTLHKGQLVDRYEGLFSLNLRNSSLSQINKNVEIFLNFSSDESKTAYTPNDDTCCAGINYTNNTLNILNLKTGQEVIVYDEWGEFKNKSFVVGDEAGGEEYVPRNAFFSPNGEWVAISIVGNKVLATIRKIGSGAATIMLNDKQVIGWIDENRLLLGKVYKWDWDYGRVKDIQYDEVSIYNISTRNEQITHLKNISPLLVE